MPTPEEQGSTLPTSRTQRKSISDKSYTLIIGEENRVVLDTDLFNGHLEGIFVRSSNPIYLWVTAHPNAPSQEEKAARGGFPILTLKNFVGNEFFPLRYIPQSSEGTEEITRGFYRYPLNDNIRIRAEGMANNEVNVRVRYE